MLLCFHQFVSPPIMCQISILHNLSGAAFFVVFQNSHLPFLPSHLIIAHFTRTCFNFFIQIFLKNVFGCFFHSPLSSWTISPPSPHLKVLFTFSQFHFSRPSMYLSCQFLFIIQPFSVERIDRTCLSLWSCQSLRKCLHKIAASFVQRIFWYFWLLFVELDFGKSPQTFSGALAGVSLKARSWRDFGCAFTEAFRPFSNSKIFPEYGALCLPQSFTPPQSDLKIHHFKYLNTY